VRRGPVVASATLLLVAIGALEASESARQLAEAVGGPQLQAAGAGLTALGLLASMAVYVALGWWAGEDRAALRLGAVTGVVAGLVGGAVRAWLIAGAVRDAVERYAAVPDWFVPAALTIYVTLAVVASAVGGAAIAFAGVRIAKVSRVTRG
jgi:hypothetical protein